MASTNKTTNYELSQFIETDKPGWLTDYNGDMRTIDSTMKAISDVASGASGSISELADRMSTAEGNITTNTNDIAALDARADALEAGAQSTAGTIANIQTEQTVQNLGIEAATELGYNLARPYDSASTYAVGAYVLFQNTLYKCITAVSVGEAFDPTKWLAIKATDEIGAGGYTLPGYHHYSASDIASISNARVSSGTAQTVNCSINDAYSIANILFVVTEFTLYGFQLTSSSGIALQADLAFTQLVEVPSPIRAISQSISGVSSGSGIISIKNFENRNPSFINTAGLLNVVLTAIVDGTTFPDIKVYTTFAIPLK